MSRVQVDTPDQFLFSIQKSVGISDVNYARHLDSVNMVRFLHEARLQFLASLGFTEGNIFGLGMVVTDMVVDYRAESFANDCLVFDVGVSNFNRYGLDVVLRVTNSALDSVVCQAKVGVVFFDFDKHQINPMPEAFTAILQDRMDKLLDAPQTDKQNQPRRVA